MSTRFIGKHKVAVISATVLILAAGVWGVVARSSSKVKLPKDLSVEALQAESADPSKVMDRVRQAMASGNLNDEQRHALWQNVHTVMETQMDQRMDEYFTAPASERQAILDRHIDEMQVRMREFEQRRTQWEQERRTRDALNSASTAGNAGTAGAAPTAGPGSAPRPGPPGGPGAGPEAGRRGGHFGPPSREERKMHTEARDPDRSARRMAYFTAIRGRMQQRGIEMRGPMGRGGPR
jgi:hypothetical protein